MYTNIHLFSLLSHTAHEHIPLKEASESQKDAGEGNYWWVTMTNIPSVVLNNLMDTLNNNQLQCHLDHLGLWMCAQNQQLWWFPPFSVRVSANLWLWIQVSDKNCHPTRTHALKYWFDNNRVVCAQASVWYINTLYVVRRQFLHWNRMIRRCTGNADGIVCHRLSQTSDFHASAIETSFLFSIQSQRRPNTTLNMYDVASWPPYTNKLAFISFVCAARMCHGSWP